MSDDSANKPPLTQSQQQNEQKQMQQQQHQFSAGSGMAKQSQGGQSQGGQSQGVQGGGAENSIDQTGFFSSYRPAPNVYDENVDQNGVLRPQWKLLSERLNLFKASGLENRCKQIRRIMLQNGHAYSAYGDPAVRDKHLQLDPLPQLIPAAQWQHIDASLKQRADLLNLLLADLYGERKLLTDGVLPPEVLYCHPHYQLPHHALPTVGGRHMHFYAAELIRSPSGNWWVKSDRTDSPGGSGFALENRIVISRTFPNEFRACNVQRLAPYFNALREHLVSLSRQNKENPHIAILSAGAGSVSYFEDSFLARYLGFTLVEANDLVVRSGKVMLKTLSRLAPIDVILRRQQGNSLDPLELGGGAPGIAGILQAIRDENIVVVNNCGSGLVESPIFMAFMPRICNALLGTDLTLPGVATWWGGEPQSLELMLDRIDDINLVPAFRRRNLLDGSRKRNANRFDPMSVKPETMTRSDRIALLKQHPLEWVGQEKVARSSAAVWEDESLRCGFISLRTFLTASGDSWCSLPGGLTRVSDRPDDPMRNPFENGGAKDVWVLADSPVIPTSLLTPSNEQLKPSRSSGFLPSRVADNLCWLGRYLVRAEAAARLLRSVLTRLTDETNPEDQVELPVLIRSLSLSGQIDAGYAIKEMADKLPPLGSNLPRFALDHSDPNSLRSYIDRVVGAASQVRDRLSSDSWRIVQQMSGNFDSSNAEDCDLVDLLDMTDTLIGNIAAFSGLTNESMTRTNAFRFLNIGRRLEHALQIIGLIKNCFANQTQVSNAILGAVLEISDSSMTYRSRYYANLQLHTVLDLLLLDELNPRSLAFQLSKLDLNLESLPDNSGPAPQSTDRRLAMDALHSVRMSDVLKLAQIDANGERALLRELLERIEGQLPLISTSISNRFLVHSGPINQMIADEFNFPK